MRFSKLVAAALMAVLCATALVAGQTAPAQAADATTDPAAAAATVAGPPSAEGTVGVTANGCSDFTCIEAGLSSPNAGWVRASTGVSGCLKFVHFHFWGPGFNFNTPEANSCLGVPTQWFGPYRPGTYCVEGWIHDKQGNQYHSIGLPCVTI